ncbi:MAG: CRISPR-associated protein Csx19 [Proteobacteria bacterium]|nr:CRISPR-associated protein Csx19 [Pseudomonadota bacterium]
MLELKTIEKSSVQVNESSFLEELLSRIVMANGNFIAYMDNEILIGKVLNNKLIPVENSLDLSFLKILRVFNLQKEYFLWTDHNKYFMRLRDDTIGDEIDVIEAKQLIYGTRVIEKDNYSVLTEDRGIELKIPYKGLTIDEYKNRLFLLTRSYIGYTKTNVATYIDFRCLAFTNNEKIL